MSHDMIYHSGCKPGCSEPRCCVCLGGRCETEYQEDPADKWFGSIQSKSMRERARGKNYKFLYKQQMYRKGAKFLVVLGAWNEEVDVFDIENMVDEVMSEFEADQEAVAKDMVATGAKKATTAEKVCKQSSASVANGARGFKASKKNLKKCSAAKSSKIVLKRPSGIFVVPNGFDNASSQKEKENISPQMIHI